MHRGLDNSVHSRLVIVGRVDFQRLGTKACSNVVLKGVKVYGLSFLHHDARYDGDLTAKGNFEINSGPQPTLLAAFGFQLRYW